VSSEQTRHIFVVSSQRKGAPLGSACAFGLVAVLALGVSPVCAREKHKPPQVASGHVSKEPFGDIPKGPIEIFVSIDQQKLHLYSDGMHIADTSVATGVPALPTPLGMFSVIQKQVFHRSNIYSGAPMPFMQRITWSGVALHEGENIGHRASHGCIRMPREFAMRLYQLTKLGARVVVANGELKPSVFADSHLFFHMVVVPATAAAAADLVKTAQVSDGTKATDAVAAKSDGPPVVAANAPVPATAELGKTAPTGDDAKTTDAIAAKPEAPPAADANAPVPATAEPMKTAQTGDDANTTDAIPVKPDASPLLDAEPVPVMASSEAEKTAQTGDDAQTTDVAAAKPDALPAGNTVAPPSSPAKPKSLDSLRGTDANPTLTVDAADGEIPIPLVKPAEAAQSAAERKTPIAVFVSRKEQRIYVRQNFEPMFDAAVIIEHPEQPLGTHLFTAMAYLDDGSTFRWDVVSLPAEAPKSKRNEEGDARSERHGKGRHEEGSAAKLSGDLPPPQTPAEALARIEIPQDIVARISELMVPGSSLIVSDHGLGDETGEGTDFVVVTR
jgi:hypothetical protein